MPSRHLHVLTGKQWDEFIRLLTPGEQQAFLADVFKVITEHTCAASTDDGPLPRSSRFVALPFPPACG